MTGRRPRGALLSGGVDIDRILLTREQFYTDKIRPAPRVTATAIGPRKRTVTLSPRDALPTTTGHRDGVLGPAGCRCRAPYPGRRVPIVRSLADSRGIWARLGRRRIAIVGGGSGRA